MQEEHEAFMLWAAQYELGVGAGRNPETDRAFLERRCGQFLELTDEVSLEEMAGKVIAFCQKLEAGASRPVVP